MRPLKTPVAISKNKNKNMNTHPLGHTCTEVCGIHCAHVSKIKHLSK